MKSQNPDIIKIHVKQEREKARELRKSRWWQEKIQNAKCYYCEKDLNPDECTMDHIVPMSRGGFSQKGNVVVSCKSCNSEKSSYTAVELLLNKIKDE